MQEVVGSVEGIRFDLEVSLESQHGAQTLPFPGMDKSGAAVCTFYLHGACNKGDACPFRHLRGDRTVVCKHWLRRLCKKGDDCEFLHEYDMSKMPECYFFSKFGQCGNKECPFLHIDPEKKMRDCPWYDRGYCRHGAICNNRHIRRVICQNYLAGFCLDGLSCKFVHPRFDIPPPDPIMIAKKASMVCHYCGEYGHKAIGCPKVSETFKADNPPDFKLPPPQPANQINPHPAQMHHHQPYFKPMDSNYQPRQRKPLEEITCYKCGEKGHFASRCNKGYLAFLSNTAQQAQSEVPQVAAVPPVNETPPS